MHEAGYTSQVKKAAKGPKFSFEELRIAATSLDASVRKKVFQEYFEMFGEFPSYLYDNSNGIDSRLSETIADLKNDPETSEKMQKGLGVLLQRLG
jgi:hypothetical protein